MRGFAVACALASWLAASACSGDVGRSERVLLVGIDGATLRVAQPLLESRRLPQLARMAGRGVYGPLRAHLPLSSPRLWTSIATGKLPRNHGVLGFSREDEDGTRRLYLGSDRTAHALWNIASQAGLTVGVINWWNTYPLEKIRGVMVSDHALPGEIGGRRILTGAVDPKRGPVVYPERWAERVAKLLGDDGALTAIGDPFRERNDFPEWANPEKLSRIYRTDQAVTRVALEVERELSPGLLMVFLPGIDRVSHVLWGALEPAAAYPKGPSMTASEREASAQALRRYYEFTDALIGLLLERYTEEDLVMVVSDHGFEAGRSLKDITGVHQSPKAARGVLFARGRGIAASAKPRRVSVNDITPTILAWLGLPVADDMDGRPADFLGGRSVETIASYDTTPIERLGEAPSGAEPVLLEQLEALGYVEDGPSP